MFALLDNPRSIKKTRFQLHNTSQVFFIKPSARSSVHLRKITERVKGCPDDQTRKAFWRLEKRWYKCLVVGGNCLELGRFNTDL